MKYVQNTLTAMLMLLCLVEARAAAGQEKIIHSFNGTDGASPQGGLLLDAKGNLFGTTAGTVFELSPVAGGGWAEKVLYQFGETAGDGTGAVGSLISDGRGDLFGVTTNGGTYDAGTVFELSPAAGDRWAEKVLYSFVAFNLSGTANGSVPNGGLILDAHGNLYGTTTYGGAGSCNCGTVFKLTPEAGGAWTEKVLYSFGVFDSDEALPLDGAYPLVGLTIDSNGNLYGTTFAGGGSLAGTVFELTRQNDGSWSETILHGFGSFNGDGVAPLEALVLDTKGNLYGTTASGGNGAHGTVFELSPSGEGAWTETLISLATTTEFSFSNLAIDPIGDLYGTSFSGGSNGQGTVYEVLRQPDGTLGSGTILYTFPGSSDDGIGPVGTLIFDNHGNLCGTTFEGGTYDDGTVFEIEAVAQGGPMPTTVSAPFPSTSTPLIAGEPITLQVTVAPTGLAIPTGMVTFADPAGGSVTVPVIAGTATYYGKVPPVGTYSVYARYSGGSGFLPSQSATITRTVIPPPPQ